MAGKKKLTSEPTDEKPIIEETWIPVTPETRADYEMRLRKWKRIWQLIAERVFAEDDSEHTDTDW